MLTVVLPFAASTVAHARGQALLVGAPGDVAAVERLVSRNFDVATLPGPAATVDAVTSGIAALTERVHPDEPALVYFSGAGGRLRDLGADEPDPWDEAWVLADGILTDDALAGPLAALVDRASAVTLVVDAGRSRDLELHSARDGGDFAGGWARTTSPKLTVVEAARLGEATVRDGRGAFTQVLLAAAPKAPTWSALAQRATADALSQGLPPPGFSGALDGPVLGVPTRTKVAPVRRFEPSPVVIPVALAPGVPSRLAEALAREPRVALGPTGRLTVRPDAAHPDQLEIVEGGLVKLQLVPTAYDDAVTLTLAALRDYAAQAALLGLGLPEAPVEVTLVPVATCGVWTPAAPNAEQVVPACARWKVHVASTASVAQDVGGVVLFSDGHVFPFPADGSVTLAPGAAIDLDPSRDGREGVQSGADVGIPEHVLVITAPAGAHVSFDGLARDPEASAPRGEYAMRLVPFRVERTPDPPADGELRAKELTLDGFDLTPYYPKDESSYLYRVLWNVHLLASRRPELEYRQCVANDAKQTASKWHSSRWPGGACWGAPFDFRQDEAQLATGPGIDCNTTMWWTFTRACQGDASLVPPAKATPSQLRAFHSQNRRCLLFTDVNDRGGRISTEEMAKPAGWMTAHWDSCFRDLPYRTGDVLVSRNAAGSRGHTYLVIDGERGVVFGSQGADLSERLTAEDEAIRDGLSGAPEPKDWGPEFQFLVRGTAADPFAGFDHQEVVACWRHREIAREWEQNPLSRPFTRPTNCLEVCP